MRWLKFAIYLMLSYVVFQVSLTRLYPWIKLFVGPAGWLPDLPNPLIWALLWVGALVFVVFLVVDVGFGAIRIPKAVYALAIFAFGIAMIVHQADERGKLNWSSNQQFPPPGPYLSDLMQEIGKDLGDHYRQTGSFPRSYPELNELLVSWGKKDIQSPYIYTWLRRKPISFRFIDNAQGPEFELEPEDLPGTMRFAVSSDGQSYWLTAISGTGAPANPVLLGGASGRPFVQSNLPIK